MLGQSTLPKKTLYQVAGWTLIVEFFLLLCPLVILGSAINWPQTLGDPANVMLPLIHEKAASVRWGYLIYLVYSILFWPVALLTNKVFTLGGMRSVWLRIAMGFGLASMVARCLGIIRWVVAMPALAALYVNSASSETREAITVVYQALNDYAGSVGEVLGVSLFAALWLAIVSLVILQTKIVPHWLGFWGLVSAVLLVTQIAETFGIDLGGFITVPVTVVQFWFLALGIVLLRSAR